MSDTDAPSRGARVRIRVFSVILGVLGGVLALALGLATSLGAGPALGTRPVTSDDYYSPWRNPHPTAAALDGDAWRGRGQQYVPLTGLTPGKPLLVEYDRKGPIDGVYLGTLDGKGEDASSPVSFTQYGDKPTYIVPATSDPVLWIRTRTGDEWTLRVVPAPAEERSGTVSGTGPAAFVYVGDATAARVVTRGRYSVTIDIVTRKGNDDLFRSYTAPEATVAWPDTPSAVFVVGAQRDSAWSIEFIERSPSPSPSPGSSPSPAPSGGAS